jgi:hypothetical protein
MACWGERDDKDKIKIAGICDSCGMPVNEDGDSIEGCGYSPVECETCGYAPCQEYC